MRIKDYTTAINIRVLLRIIGLLLMIEGCFFIIPIATALIYHEKDWACFLMTMIVTLTAGSIMTFGIKPRTPRMGKREGFLLTAMVWVFFSIFGMIPFIFMERGALSVSDAFFEAMSGFTTTGATVMSSISHLSNSVIMWRCLMQWIGGMGIILFTLAVLPMLNHSGGMQMFNAEVTGITHDKLRPRISQTAKGLWIIYVVLTGVLFGLLALGPMSIFDSICHAFSTMSTGGFSTVDESIEAWKSEYVEAIVTLFMFIGGTSFVLIYRAANRDFRPIIKNDVFKTYVGIILVCYLLFVVSIVFNGQAKSVKSVTLDPLFQIISCITSTGYEISSFPEWGTFTLGLVLVLMFFGGCAGSTSGGAKIDRLIYLLKNCRNEIVRCIYPNNIFIVRVNGRVIPHDIVTKVTAFLCLYVLIIVVAGIILMALGLPLIDSFFSSFSCICNTGLGSNVTGLGGDYTMIPDAGKWVLALVMMTGRLEIFTVLILFTPTFWKK